MPEIYHALLDAICGSQSEHLFKNSRLSKRLSKIKIEQKRLPSKMLGSLDFTGREGGIRTHGGSSPHLISSQAPSTTRTPLHALARHDAL